MDDDEFPNYTVVESEKAKADIKAIEDNEAIDPKTGQPYFTDAVAAKTAKRVQDRVNKLGSIPHGGTDTTIGGTIYQRTVEKPFNIYWLPDDAKKEVNIVRIINGSRDQEAEF